MKRTILGGIILALYLIGCSNPTGGGTPSVTYTVTYDAQGGTAIASLTGIASGSTIAQPAAPTKQGFTFAGWYKDSGFATAWNFATDTVTSDITLYAKWSAISPVTYTVTFDAQGGTAIASLTGIASGSTIAQLAAPMKQGFTFAGWYKDSGFATAWNFATDTVTSDITLYAKWSAISPATYAVTFDAQGGTAIASLTGIASGSTITQPAAPTKQGFTFAGWYKDSGFATAWNFATDTVTSDITLYAKWSAIPPAIYAVTFDVQGGTAIASLTGIASGSTITQPAAPTRPGFTFAGWYKDSGFATAWNFATDTVTSDITLYAKWSAIPPAIYAVTFDVQGGTAVASLTGLASGSTIAQPAAPTKQGFTFAGWYKDSAFATSWNFAVDTVTSNTTLYAKWSAIPTYTVTFAAQGGSAVASLTGLASGSTIAQPAAPTKQGFTFAGWYKDSAFATAWNFTADTVTSDTTLYAKWSAIPTYTVTFAAQGGSAVASLTGLASGSTITQPAAPTKQGFTFAGWFKDSAFATAWNFAADTVTSDTTLYAKWSANPTYTVTFAAQGGSAVASLTGLASGSTITQPAAPTKQGFTFAGWFKDSAFATAWNFAADTVTSDTTLYAKWTNQAGGTTTIVNPSAYLVTITGDPTVHYGVQATFNSTYTGQAEAYQWYLNGSPISGATGSSLTLTPTIPAMPYGANWLTLLISDTNGIVYSGALTIAIAY